jgi:hypothetical protein
VDRQGRLLVIELKRTSDDSFADLQALRYAAMVSRMTFDEAVETYRRYLSARNQEVDPRAALLEFLGWGDQGDGRFGEDVRIILAAADFSPEVTSTVLWLNERDLDINCVRLQPYRSGTSVLLDVQQIIPLPEAADYQVQIRQKQREVRAAAEQAADWTRYDVRTGSESHTALYKRHVMFVVTKYLIENGVIPEELERVTERKMFEVVDGEVTGDSFRAELNQRRPNDPSFVKRYFSRDDQLFVVKDKTYALTNQWSKMSMEPAMTEIIARFGDRGISYNVTSQS